MVNSYLKNSGGGGSIEEEQQDVDDQTATSTTPGIATPAQVSTPTQSSTPRTAEDLDTSIGRTAPSQVGSTRSSTATTTGSNTPGVATPADIPSTVPETPDVQTINTDLTRQDQALYEADEQIAERRAAGRDRADRELFRESERITSELAAQDGQLRADPVGGTSGGRLPDEATQLLDTSGGSLGGGDTASTGELIDAGTDADVSGGSSTAGLGDAWDTATDIGGGAADAAGGAYDFTTDIGGGAVQGGQGFVKTNWEIGRGIADVARGQDSIRGASADVGREVVGTFADDPEAWRESFRDAEAVEGRDWEEDRRAVNQAFDEGGLVNNAKGAYRTVDVGTEAILDNPGGSVQETARPAYQAVYGGDNPQELAENLQSSYQNYQDTTDGFIETITPGPPGEGRTEWLLKGSRDIFIDPTVRGVTTGLTGINPESGEVDTRADPLDFWVAPLDFAGVGSAGSSAARFLGRSDSAGSVAGRLNNPLSRGSDDAASRASQADESTGGAPDSVADLQPSDESVQAARIGPGSGAAAGAASQMSGVIKGAIRALTRGGRRSRNVSRSASGVSRSAPETASSLSRGSSRAPQTDLGAADTLSTNLASTPRSIGTQSKFGSAGEDLRGVDVVFDDTASVSDEQLQGAADDPLSNVVDESSDLTGSAGRSQFAESGAVNADFRVPDDVSGLRQASGGGSDDILRPDPSRIQGIDDSATVRNLDDEPASLPGFRQSAENAAQASDEAPLPSDVLAGPAAAAAGGVRRAAGRVRGGTESVIERIGRSSAAESDTVAQTGRSLDDTTGIRQSDNAIFSDDAAGGAGRAGSADDAAAGGASATARIEDATGTRQSDELSSADDAAGGGRDPNNPRDPENPRDPDGPRGGASTTSAGLKIAGGAIGGALLYDLLGIDDFMDSFFGGDDGLGPGGKPGGSQPGQSGNWKAEVVDEYYARDQLVAELFLIEERTGENTWEEAGFAVFVGQGQGDDYTQGALIVLNQSGEPVEDDAISEQKLIPSPRFADRGQADTAAERFINSLLEDGGGGGSGPGPGDGNDPGQHPELAGEVDVPSSVENGQAFEAPWVAELTGTDRPLSGRAVLGLGTDEELYPLAEGEVTIPEGGTSDQGTFVAQGGWAVEPADYDVFAVVIEEDEPLAFAQSRMTVTESTGNQKPGGGGNGGTGPGGGGSGADWGEAQLVQELPGGWYLFAQERTDGSETRFMIVGKNQNDERIYIHPEGRVETEIHFFPTAEAAAEAHAAWVSRVENGQATQGEVPDPSAGRPSPGGVTRDAEKSSASDRGTSGILDKMSRYARQNPYMTAAALAVAMGAIYWAYREGYFDDTIRKVKSSLGRYNR
jgi:hypothetical protein